MNLTGKIIAAGLVVIIAVAVMYYFMVHQPTKVAGTSPKDANADPSLGRPPYYTKPTYDMIQSKTFSGPQLSQFNLHTIDVLPWRDPYSDEWGPMCASLSMTFGYDVPKAAAGDPSQNQILTWAKGMNVNPVHAQLYLWLFKDDIKAFAKSGVPASKTGPWGVKAGEFIAA